MPEIGRGPLAGRRRSWSERRWLNALDRSDVALYVKIGQFQSPALDRIMPALTRAADHSKLWMAVAATAKLSGDKAMTRAAIRGLGSIAVASLLANQVAKRILPRRRPDPSVIPGRRLARRLPKSASFPSGHSAAAAAFAVGATLESRRLGAAAGVLAAGVAVSRVYTGAHYPSDVAAGVAMGAGSAALLARVVPVIGNPAEQRHEPLSVVEQPPRKHGEGVVAVINPRSGSGSGTRLIELLRQELPAAEVLELGRGEDLADELRRVAPRAEVLAVGGGDGSVNAGAQVALEAGLPLLTLPGGTFNHFTGDLGVTNPRQVIQALRDGCAVKVDVGIANGMPFVNTASIGSYPKFVITRERWEPRVGKPLAAALSAVRTLIREVPMHILVDGEHHSTGLLFVGNGAYEPTGFVPTWRPQLDDGLLDLRLLDVGKPFAISRFVVALLTGRLASSPLYVERRVKAAQIVIESGSTELARDGEVSEGEPEITFTLLPGALTVFRPQ
jgi:undecaprenyl-diphosphatase